MNVRTGSEGFRPSDLPISTKDVFMIFREYVVLFYRRICYEYFIGIRNNIEFHTLTILS